MRKLSLKVLVVASCMVCTAGLAHLAKPTEHLSDSIGKPDLENLFPTSFAGWQVDRFATVIQPSPDVQAKLASTYNQVLTRTYMNAKSERIMLSVAYGGDQSNGTRAHRPEVCYPAQGFQITYSAQSSVSVVGQSLPVRQLMSKLGSRNEPITYWVVVGGQVATSHFDQRMAELRYSLRGLIADGMLVRVSSIGADMTAGHDLQQRFLADLANAQTSDARARVFGGSLY